jgi:hypothetical protein
MKKLLFLAACLWLLAAPLRAAAGPPAVAVVRIYESVIKVTAIITRAEGKSEQVEFAKGPFDKRLIESSEGYYKLFQSLYQEGYSLQSTFTTPRSEDNSYTTLLFVKAQ